MTGRDDRKPLVVRSEFAIVEVDLVATHAGGLLRITDLAGGATATFDALELEGLCALGADDRERLASPEWRMHGKSAPDTILGDRPEGGSR